MMFSNNKPKQAILETPIQPVSKAEKHPPAKPGPHPSSAWTPPSFATEEELQSFLKAMFDEWETLTQAQKGFYESQIANLQRKQRESAATAQRGVEAKSTSSAMDIKKRLEARRQAIDEQKKGAEISTSPPPSQIDAAAAPKVTQTVAEKLAAKKAQMRLQENVAKDAHPSTSIPAATPVQSQHQPLPPHLLNTFHVHFPLPPKFPVKFDSAAQRNIPSPRAAIRLEDIPEDILLRIAPEGVVGQIKKTQITTLEGL
jgi:hypothetical protein